MTEFSTDVADSEKKFFNELVSEHGEFNPFSDRGWHSLRDTFRLVLACLEVDVCDVERILDVGCGTGESSRIYEGVGQHYTGVDLAEAAITRAKELHPDKQWQVSDACQLPFANNEFDVVAFSSLLHHIPDFPTAVAEAFRVLRPGGVAFAYDPNLLHPAMALLRHPRSPMYLSEGVSPNEKPLLPSAVLRAFHDSGLRPLFQRCKSDIPFRYVAPRGVNVFIPMFNLVDWFWERCQLGRVFGTFVITAGRKPTISLQ